MGLFKKVKDGMNQATGAADFAQQHAGGQPAPGQLGVPGLPVDPAALGGPSSQPLDTDDPMLQPVNGIAIADYARVAREAQARGVTDEVGMNAVAAELGYDPAVFGPAVQEWIRRMGQSMVVGQQIRAAMGY